MTAETLDPIALFAQLNPIPVELLDDLSHGPERETTFARIVARREAPAARARRVPRRRLVAAVVVALALAIPALAFSGALDSLFGFSNQGASVTQDPPWLVDEIHMITGDDPTKVVLLADRDGWTFYAARTASDVCYFSAPPPHSESDGIPNGPPGGGSCKNAAGEPDFPSPTRPVFNMSHYLNNSTVVTLAGVAADAVASVQVLALSDCHVVVTAPVTDNVYLADNLPVVPESQIVARDAGGNVVWHQAVGAAVEPAPPSNSCGLAG
jgi:hypothetical protein